MRAARSKLLLPSVGPDEELKEPDPKPRAAALSDGDHEDWRADSTALKVFRSTPVPGDPFNNEDRPFALPAIACQNSVH